MAAARFVPEERSSTMEGGEGVAGMVYIELRGVAVNFASNAVVRPVVIEVFGRLSATVPASPNPSRHPSFDC